MLRALKNKGGGGWVGWGGLPGRCRSAGASKEGKTVCIGCGIFLPSGVSIERPVPQRYLTQLPRSSHVPSHQQQPHPAVPDPHRASSGRRRMQEGGSRSGHPAGEGDESDPANRADLLRGDRPDPRRGRGRGARPRERDHRVDQFPGGEAGEEGPGPLHDRSAAVRGGAGDREGKVHAGEGRLREGEGRRHPVQAAGREERDLAGGVRDRRLDGSRRRRAGRSDEGGDEDRGARRQLLQGDRAGGRAHRQDGDESRATSSARTATSSRRSRRSTRST